MGTILGTWNPVRWPWDAYPDAYRATAAGRIHRLQWSVHRRRHGVAPGDRFFLLKQGVEPRGIVAAGTIVDGPADGAHWSGRPGATTRYVTVDLDTVVDIDDVLPVEQLRARLPRTH
ncbi:MAG: hypothetical protein ACTHMS_12705 [Jatrophihabitans sp.]|uniref:hypothetical protein n=1 Tax=Jatrophihabitans sp. TaxID=1932789 RepID=UPI003F7F665E